MTPTPYSLSLLERIKKKNKRKPVTVDSLIEGKTWTASDKIIAALQGLRSEGLITCISVLDHGKFATEITGFEGWKEHGKVPGKLRAESSSEEIGSASAEPKPRRKNQKRNVRRSLV